MVKQKDENSNSSSDESSNSSFSSTTKPRTKPAVSKNEQKPRDKNNGSQQQQNKAASTSSIHPSLINLTSNPSQQQQPQQSQQAQQQQLQQQQQQQLIYANPSNSLFNKINSFSGTSQLNTQQALQLQNLASMKNQLANQLAAVNSNGPGIPASNNLSAQYDQVGLLTILFRSIFNVSGNFKKNYLKQNKI